MDTRMRTDSTPFLPPIAAPFGTVGDWAAVNMRATTVVEIAPVNCWKVFRILFPSAWSSVASWPKVTVNKLLTETPMPIIKRVFITRSIQKSAVTKRIVIRNREIADKTRPQKIGLAAPIRSIRNPETGANRASIIEPGNMNSPACVEV